MINIAKQCLLTVSLLVATAHSESALSQNKVVVVPLGAESATPNVTFVAFGVVENGSPPTFSMLSLPPGVDASVASNVSGEYTISLNGYTGTLNAVVFVTPITSSGGDPDHCNTHSSTSSTPGSFIAEIQCFVDTTPILPSSMYWMIMG